MYKCRCGAVFSDYELGADEKCPLCGRTDRYASANICEICGNAFPHHRGGFYNGFCAVCAKEMYDTLTGFEFIGWLDGNAPFGNKKAGCFDDFVKYAHYKVKNLEDDKLLMAFARRDMLNRIARSILLDEPFEYDDDLRQFCFDDMYEWTEFLNNPGRTV